MVVGGCGQLRMVVDSCGWLQMVVAGCGQLWMVAGSCGWLQMIMVGCAWLWMIAYFSISHKETNKCNNGTHYVRDSLYKPKTTLDIVKKVVAYS